MQRKNVVNEGKNFGFQPTSEVGTTGNSENFSHGAIVSTETQMSAMSAKCDQLFSYLTPPAREQEKEYRHTLLDTCVGYRHSRYKFGEALSHYWAWCKRPEAKQKQEQGETFGKLCEILGVEKRTGYNILQDYTRACSVWPLLRQAADEMNIDLGERSRSPLVEELKSFANPESFAEPVKEAKLIVEKAIQNVNSRPPKTTPPAPPTVQQLRDFLLNLYGGKATYAQMRSEVEEALKNVASYKRVDQVVFTKKEWLAEVEEKKK